MKRTLIATAGLALVAACGVANAASWSVFVEPGVYGRVAIGGYLTAPVVLDEQPVVAIDPGAPAPVVEYDDGGVPVYAPPVYDQPPVYMWVPDWQRLHWADACREYGACGVPVYFVQDDWYRANVIRRAWTPEQRGWSQAQWIEQDRVARERWERQRWDREQGWRQQQQWRVEQDRSRQQWQRDQERAQEQTSWDRARYEHERADYDRQARERADHDQQDHMRWQQLHGLNVQPVAAWQPGQRPQPVYNAGNPNPTPNGSAYGRGNGWQGGNGNPNGNANGNGWRGGHDNGGARGASGGGSAPANGWNGQGNGHGGPSNEQGGNGRGARGAYEQHPGGNVDR